MERTFPDRGSGSSWSPRVYATRRGTLVVRSSRDVSPIEIPIAMLKYFPRR
jgi:hypothetical protein